MLEAMNLMNGPAALTIAWMAAVISALWTCAYVLLYFTLAMVVTGGDVTLKMYHTATYLCHWTPNKVAGAAVHDGFTINFIFCVVNIRLTNSAQVRASLEGLMLFVGTTFAVFSLVYKEEECNTGEVTDGFLYRSSWT